MKKNNLERFAIAAIFFVCILGSCKKENSLPAESDAFAKTSDSSDAVTTAYYLCNKSLNVFDPPASTYYSFALQNATKYRYGIEDYKGVISFQNIDKFSFEFSGLYAEAANSVKLYYIRRRDGKYLSFELSTGWREKFDPRWQLWIISKIGDNKYNLMLPNVCYLMRIYYDNSYNSYRAGFISSDQTTYPGTIDVYMLPDISLPPITK